VLYGRTHDARDAVEVVRGIYDAFARRDVEAVIALAHPDGEFHLAGTAAAVGRTEPYRGHEGLREYFAQADSTWDELRIEAADIRATATGVVVFGHVHGRIGEDRVARQVVWTWQVRDGRAASVRVSDLKDLG
jgi:ketosteroid isomerase-like protein